MTNPKAHVPTDRLTYSVTMPGQSFRAFGDSTRKGNRDAELQARRDARVRSPVAGLERRDAYLTVREVAALARCAQKTCRRAIDAGRLAAFKPAGRLLIRAEDARAWIERPVHPDRLMLPARPRAVKRPQSAAAKGSFADLMRIDAAVGGRQTRRPLS